MRRAFRELDAPGWMAVICVAVVVAWIARDCTVRHVDDGDDSIHVVIR